MIQTANPHQLTEFLELAPSEESCSLRRPAARVRMLLALFLICHLLRWLPFSNQISVDCSRSCTVLAGGVAIGVLHIFVPLLPSPWQIKVFSILLLWLLLQLSVFFFPLPRLSVLHPVLLVKLVVCAFLPVQPLILILLDLFQPKASSFPLAQPFPLPPRLPSLPLSFAILPLLPIFQLPFFFILLLKLPLELEFSSLPLYQPSF